VCAWLRGRVWLYIRQTLATDRGLLRLPSSATQAHRRSREPAVRAAQASISSLNACKCAVTLGAAGHLYFRYKSLCGTVTILVFVAVFVIVTVLHLPPSAAISAAGKTSLMRLIALSRSWSPPSHDQP